MAGNKQGISVLIIEDNQEIRESTAEILMLSDYTVYTAEDGKLGVDLALRHLPNIILCDIMMPELDGYGVLFMLSKNEKTKNIPFIFLTAKVDRSDLRKAMEMGADDYLTKPFDDIELLNAIEARLKRKQGMEEAQLQSFFSVGEYDEQELLEELLENSRVKGLKNRQSVYDEGDHPHFLYYVKKGRVRGYLFHDDGRELVSGIYNPGDFFGHEALLLDQAYNHSTDVLEPSEVVLIQKDSFLELLFRKPSLAKMFLERLSDDVSQKENQLLGFAYDSVRKKVANALVKVAVDSEGSEVDECVIRVSRDNLSAIAGTAHETISRMLRHFIDESLITKKGNAIHIYSIKKLREIKA
ncbi:MAG TPA: response regulator [Candidatus Sphingobacterium stercoripullorum]|uniref:Response regulator n=1 Tax=Candidatus Sphingobacterium stercoripullorum TaxID=2838759 RepID=A0A9D1W998_9SPHI|nr:response regulator [Candidatus Sphingobacterium stercoripullorum]